jgi:O-antigen/teichoic acid export membrane protein
LLVRDEAVRRVIRATGVMGGAKVVSALLHLAGLALAGRILGPQEFGILILIRGFAQAASGIAKFQSWQAVIHYGAPALHRQDRQQMADILTFTVVLDSATGVAAMLGSMLIAPWLAPHVGIDANAIWLTVLYCIAIPTMSAASPTGVLRLADRFDQLGVQALITPIVRFGAMGIAALLGAGFAGIVVAWLVSDLVGDLYLWFAAAHELRRTGMVKGARADPRRMLATPGIWRFVLTTNANATLDLAWGPLSNLIVGGLAGPVAAGAYRVAQTVIDGFARPGEIATRSLYPELAKLRAQGSGDRVWSIIKRASMWSVVTGLLFAGLLALIAPDMIRLLMGDRFALTGMMLRIMAVALIPMIAAFPFESTLFAQGAVGSALSARLVAGIGGTALIIMGIMIHGIVGAAWGYVAAMLLLGAGQGIALLRVYERRHRTG